MEVSPIAEYQEHHMPAEDVGVAWVSNRIWVCVDGVSILRAKIVDGKFIVHFDKGNVELLAAIRTDKTRSSVV